MKLAQSINVIIALLLSLIFVSCAKDKTTASYGYPPRRPDIPIPYIPPIPIAGGDHTMVLPVTSGVSWPAYVFMLDGRLSSQQQNIVNYRWRQILGPSQSVFQPDAILTSVQNLVEGNYSFELQITDVQGKNFRDSVNYHVVQDSLGGKEFIFNQTWLQDG